MDSQVKMGLIIGAAIIIAVGVGMYFSPYQSCVRAGMNNYETNWKKDTFKPKRTADWAQSAALRCK